jgi:cytochrome c peroxidase
MGRGAIQRRAADGFAESRQDGHPQLELMRGALALALLLAVLPAAAAESWRWMLPPGFTPPLVPADNPMSAAKVELGRRLFFDAGLSEDGRTACATCHKPERAYSEGVTLPRGARGDLLARNAPSLTNVAYAPALGWTDEGVATLEAQMLRPLFATHPVEMGLAGREAQVIAGLARDAGYAAAFAAAFPEETDPVTLVTLVRAIACFERTLISGRSAFDRYVFDDDRNAMSEAARRGMALFYSTRVGCGACHGGLAFSGALQAVGSAAAAAVYADTGTGEQPGMKFKVPGLRNVALTSPYLHDGRFGTLRAVVDFYDRGAGRRRLKALRLRENEKGDLVAFLGSLTDPGFVSPP